MELKLVLSIIIFAIVMIILIVFKWKEMKEIREEALEKEPREEKLKSEIPPLDILEKDSDFRKILEKFTKDEKDLIIPIGQTEEEKIKTIDLDQNNNLLIIGTTGGGKSICLNEIIASIVMNYKAEDIKIVTIDTSIVELSSFNKTPHYLKETISQPQEIVEELEILYKEANRRIKNPMSQHLLVIIDDLYDVCQYSSEALSKIEALLEISDEANIKCILATDTPAKEIISKKIQEEIDATLYLTLAPGEEKDFFFEKELTEEELAYITKIGNLIYQNKEGKERIKVPDITDKEIKKIKDWFNPYR